MNAIRLTLAGLLLLTLAALAGAQDKGKTKDAVKGKLIGTWEVVKGKEVGKGDRLQFSKDGKVVVTFKMGAKDAREEATFTVTGNTLTLKAKRGAEERTRKIKIVSIGDRELILEGPRGNITLRRVEVPAGKGKKE